MSKYFDVEKIRCLTCKHLWILGSDENISDNLHKAWVTQVLIEHEFIHQKWEKRNEN